IQADPIPGGASSLLASPDGKHVYAAAANGDILTLDRSAIDGTLSAYTSFVSGVGQYPVMTADGATVYAANPDELNVLSRNATTGVLRKIQTLNSQPADPNFSSSEIPALGPRGIALTSDDSRVYVVGGIADSRLTIFTRNQGTGTLSYLGAYVSGVGGVHGMN